MGELQKRISSTIPPFSPRQPKLPDTDEDSISHDLLSDRKLFSGRVGVLARLPLAPAAGAPRPCCKTEDWQRALANGNVSRPEDSDCIDVHRAVHLLLLRASQEVTMEYRACRELVAVVLQSGSCGFNHRLEEIRRAADRRGSGKGRMDSEAAREERKRTVRDILDSRVDLRTVKHLFDDAFKSSGRWRTPKEALDEDDWPEKRFLYRAEHVTRLSKESNAQRLAWGTSESTHLLAPPEEYVRLEPAELLKHFDQVQYVSTRICHSADKTRTALPFVACHEVFVLLEKRLLPTSARFQGQGNMFYGFDATLPSPLWLQVSGQPMKELGEILSPVNKPLLDTQDLASDPAAWPRTLRCNFHGVHYNVGGQSEDADAEQQRLHQRYIGKRKETISTICQADLKDDLIVKKQPPKAAATAATTRQQQEGKDERLIRAAVRKRGGDAHRRAEGSTLTAASGRRSETNTSATGALKRSVKNLSWDSFQENNPFIILLSLTYSRLYR